MAVKRYIDLADLTLFKQLEDAEIAEAIRVAEARSLHTVAIDGNTLKFYREEEPVGSATPAYSITLPETDLSNYFEKFAVGETDYGKLVQVKYDPNGDGTFSAKLDKTDVTVNDLAKTSDLSPVATSGDASDVSITDTAGNFTSDNVEGALAELAAASSGGVASKTVYLKDESTGQSDYAKVYKLYQGSDAADMTENTLVGTINIPKDLVVQGGKVVTVTSGTDSDGDTTTVADGTYIKLTIQNQTEKLYINVADLIDDYTAQQNAPQIQLAISATNEISAEIVDGSVDTDALGTQAVTTDKIADSAVTNDKLAGNIAEGKLSQDVQDKLNASVGVTAVTTGTSGNGTIAVTTNGTTENVSVRGLGDAAFHDAAEFDTAGAATTVQSAVTGTASDTKADLTLNGLKAYIASVESDAETTEAVPESDIRALFNTASV